MSKVSRAFFALMLCAMIAFGGAPKVAYGMRKVTITKNEIDWSHPSSGARQVKKGKTRVILTKGSGMLYFKASETKKYVIRLNNMSSAKAALCYGNIYITRGKKIIRIYDARERLYQRTGAWGIDDHFVLKNKKSKISKWYDYDFDRPTNSVSIVLKLKKGELLYMPMVGSHKKPTLKYEHGKSVKTKVAYTLYIK